MRMCKNRWGPFLKGCLRVSRLSHAQRPPIFLFVHADYKWVFSEWAIARGNNYYTSDGHYFRDINLNPNGFAMHCE